MTAGGKSSFSWIWHTDNNSKLIAGTPNGGTKCSGCSFGLRPAVSLKPGIRIADGDGTPYNPFVVSTE